METAQLFQSCLLKSLSRSTRCKNVSSTTKTFDAAHSSRRQPILYHPSSNRCFSASSRSSAQDIPPTATDSSNSVPDSTPSSSRPPRAKPNKSPSLASIANAAYSSPRTSRYSSNSSKTADMMRALGPNSSTGWPESLQRPPLSKQWQDAFPDPKKDPPARDAMDILSETIESSREMREQRQRAQVFNQEELLRNMKTDDYKDIANLRLKPQLGRTVNMASISGGMDLTRAFRSLEIKCSQNKVRADERSQKTYVRRGQRKKIERMRRWRKLFQEGFLAECGRIRKMRKQGW